MQVLLANMMHQILSSKIGTEVCCMSYEDGKIVEYRGILKQVLPFDGVQIDDDFIPFVSNNKSIHEIIQLPEKTSLYMNPDTLGFVKEDFIEEQEIKYRKK